LAAEATEPLAREKQHADTTVCERDVCDREVFSGATVDVVVGAQIGEWADPTPHIGITGVADGSPVSEQWCLSCASDLFEIEKSANEARQERTKPYLNHRTVTAFVLGVLIPTLLYLLF